MSKINELQLAKELIKFPSVTQIDAGVMKFLENKLKKLGFKTSLIEFKEKNFKPVKNLYARLGNKGPNFCYAGHLDVVPPGNLEDWTVNPFKPSVKKGHLIGRGKVVHEDDIYQCMIDINDWGKKITISGLTGLLNCSSRTIHRNMCHELKKEKELLNKQITN